MRAIYWFGTEFRLAPLPAAINILLSTFMMIFLEVPRAHARHIISCCFNFMRAQRKCSAEAPPAGHTGRLVLAFPAFTYIPSGI